MERTTNSPTYKYIIVYRGSNKDTEQRLRELIIPFTESAYTWNHFISMVVLIDQDSGVTFTYSMNEYFTKYVTPPITMIDTVNCTVMNQFEQIRSEFNELLSDIDRSSTLFEGFKSITDQHTESNLASFYNPDITTLGMDQLKSEQYVNLVNQENMKFMQEYTAQRNVQQNMLQDIPTIKDTKSKTINYQTLPLNASSSISNMQLTY